VLDSVVLVPSMVVMKSGIVAISVCFCSTGSYDRQIEVDDSVSS
jgi:hypothetical protein